MPGTLRAIISAFFASARGVAAVEFAIIFPILMALTGGVYEVSRAVNASRHLTNTANSISNILATNGTGVVSYTDLHYAYDSAMLTFPEVLADAASKGMLWSNDITLSMAGISFAPLIPLCTSGCTYIASVNWTSAAGQRVCGSLLTATSDTSQPSPSTLPTDLFTPVPSSSGGNSPPPFIVVVDITYSWRPLLFAGVVSPITFKRSAYINPRYTTKISYSTISGDDGFGQKCLGF